MDLGTGLNSRGSTRGAMREAEHTRLGEGERGDHELSRAGFFSISKCCISWNALNQAERSLEQRGEGGPFGLANQSALCEGTGPGVHNTISGESLSKKNDIKLLGALPCLMEHSCRQETSPSAPTSALFGLNFGVDSEQPAAQRT